MNLPFTNTHIHVFNTQCAPDNFLRIVPSKIVRNNSAFIKKMVDSRFGRFLIDKLFDVTYNDASTQKKEWKKYVAFLDVGIEKRQLDIFLREYNVAKTFDSNPRIVGLTLNMDFMDNDSSSKHKRIETQLEEVIEIKRYLPGNFFPFLGIDPRYKGGNDLLEWSKYYFENGVKKDTRWFAFFSGIKLYPAIGYFPFDPRLAELYAYAEAKGLPIMTHCTRVGSQYIGSDLVGQLPMKPTSIMPDAVTNPAGYSRVLENHDKTIARIKSYADQNWVVNSKIGANDFPCDLFGHPLNYIPILETYPNLRICLAHMGGGNEIYANEASRKAGNLDLLQSLDGGTWFNFIKIMMVDYPNLYTDISYVLSDLDKTEIHTAMLTFFDTLDKNNKPLGDRVLFGTDFFMTEQEKKEADLFRLAAEKLSVWFDRITRVNPDRFLQQPL